MKISIYPILSILITFTFLSNIFADESDPFEEIANPEQEQASQKEFTTSGAFKVTPATGFDPYSIDLEDAPKVQAPTVFNRHFDTPFKIWKVEGGFFGAFDGGEWGGALFFATDKATKWTRIIDTHIQDLERFEGDTFLATGGLAHLSLSGGSTFLITRLPSGEWKTRMVFTSDIGIPRIVGTSVTEHFLKDKSKKLVVLGLEYPKKQSPFFGVDSTGAIHYLGEQTK